MRVADAHCDTIQKYSGNQFYTENAHWNIEKFSKVNGILQYFAICVLPPDHGDAALRTTFNTMGRFWKSKPEIINPLLSKSDFNEDKINVVLSIEGATPIIDDINNLYAFWKLGLRAMTLTWNHRNFVGDGNDDSNYGLTNFGKDVVRLMEELGMIIDVSHLNDAGFEDVVKTAAGPFAATHSNAFSVHGHPRNLKDHQIEEIISRGGFIGLNFYSPFITNNENKDKIIDAFLKHTEYFLNIGAEDVLGFGADFDGIDHTPFKDAASYSQLEELFRNRLGLPEELIEKIMYKNLVDFTLKVLPE